MIEWKPRTVAVWEEWRSGEYRAFKRDFYGDWSLEHKGAVIYADSSLQDVMDYAARLPPQLEG